MVTLRIVIFLQGVYFVHLNWATVVLVYGRRLFWLVLPLTRSKEMLVKSVLVFPFG